MSVTMTKTHSLESLHDFPDKTFSDLAIYDQRYMPRWETSQEAYYREKSRPVIVRTRMKDLTLAGASLYIKDDVSVRDCLDLKIYLSPESSFHARGVVLWKKSGTQCAYVGILFDRLPEITQRLITDHGFERTTLSDAIDIENPLSVRG